MLDENVRSVFVAIGFAAAQDESQFVRHAALADERTMEEIGAMVALRREWVARIRATANAFCLSDRGWCDAYHVAMDEWDAEHERLVNIYRAMHGIA